MNSSARGTIATVLTTLAGFHVVMSGLPARAQQPGDPVRFVLASTQHAPGYLGVNFRETSDEQVGILQLREARGVEVTQVDHDGPAGKAGIRERDVLLQVNGQGIEGVDQLRRLLHEMPAGRAVTLVLSRDGQSQTVSAVLCNREALERQAWEQHIPVPDPASGSSSAAANPSKADRGPVAGTSGSMSFLGAGAASGGSIASRTGDRGVAGSAMLPPSYTGAALESLGPQLAEFFGAADGNGLLVRSIEGNSPAAMAGLKAGDVVVRVNQVAILAGADWLRLMHESRGRAVQVTILRDKKEQILVLTPDSKRRSSVILPPLRMDPSIFAARAALEMGASPGPQI